MLEIYNDLLIHLNSIEVKGKQNLALLYNSIDIVSKLADSMKNNQNGDEQTNDNMANDTE